MAAVTARSSSRRRRPCDTLFHSNANPSSSLVSADPPAALHHQIRKVNVGDGGLPPLYPTQRGEDHLLFSARRFRGALSLFIDIHVDIFQLYDVSKGKKTALYLVSHTKQISFDKFYAGRIKKKTLK